MAEDTRPAETVVQSTPAPEFKPTEEYKVLSAAMETLAKAAGTVSEKVEGLKKIQADLAAEKKKMVPVETKDQRAPRSIKDIVRRKARTSEEREIHELNDRAMDRMIVKRYKEGTLPLDNQGLVRLDSLSKDPRWEEIEEARDLKAIQTKAAGSFWDSTTATSLDEWVPAGFSTTVLDFYTVDADIPALFEQVTIPRGVESVSVPVETTRAHAILETQTTAVSATWLNTAIFNQALGDVCTLSPLKMANGHAMSMEGVEDVVVDLLGRARMNSAKSVRQGIAEMIINGQTASDATLDDAPAVSGLYAADGWSTAGGDESLRLHCIVNSYTTAAGGPLTAVIVLAARASIGKFGARPDETVLITSPMGYLGLLADTTGVLTVDKFGPQATVLTGQLAAVGGVPVVMTSEMPETMAAGGIDAGTSTMTGAIMVNRRRWFFGTSRQLEQTLLPQPGTDVVNVITRARARFKIGVADEHSAHFVINVT